MLRGGVSPLSIWPRQREEMQRMAKKMKRQFLAPRLREWFEIDVFQNSEIFGISREVGKIYDFI